MTALSSMLVPLAILAGTVPDAGVTDGDAGPAEETAGGEPLTADTRMEVTADPSVVEIRHVHLILERKGDRLEVAQIVSLGAAGRARFSSPAGYRLPMPQGAVAPMGSGDGKAGLRTEVVEGGFLVVDSIPPGGEDATVHYEVPLTDGAASFSQRFGGKIRSLQVICPWTAGRAALEVEGAGETVAAELGNGLTALVANGRGIGERLAISVSGIESGAPRVARLAVLLLCALMMAAGAAAWWRSRRRPSGEGRGPGAHDR